MMNGKVVTEGEMRVRTDFNVTDSTVVSEIKESAAKLINLLSSIDMEGNVNSGEGERLRSLAITSIEEGAMWGVKAATCEKR